MSFEWDPSPWLICDMLIYYNLAQNVDTGTVVLILLILSLNVCFQVKQWCNINPVTVFLSRDYRCDSTTIRLRSDYNVSRAPASNSTQAENELQFFVVVICSRIVVESQL